MQALEELPETDKDRLYPFFPLRPWTSAHHLDAALDRIEEAYGRRPIFISAGESEFVETRRPVHDALDALRSSVDGYSNWCQFVEDSPNFVPVLQLQDPAHLLAQAERLHGLGRGLLVRIRAAAFPVAQTIAHNLAPVTQNGRDVCFFLDFGRANGDLLNQQMMTSGVINAILAETPNAHVAISASSFPDSFTSISHQDIYERALFNGVNDHLRNGRLIYSDRGSARVERNTGGGGIIPPRVDYAEPTQWTFFRADDAGDRPAQYQEQANLVIGSQGWDARLRLWGTQMIERTAIGDRTAITSQARATAVRINIHLHRQLFYSNPAGLYDTDEEWRD
jgi:hypothetical protein